MLTENGGHAHAPAVVNVVETYFARYLGFSQLAIGLLIVTLSGALPLTTKVTCKFRPPTILSPLRIVKGFLGQGREE